MATQFKDVFDGNPLPTEQHGKWILRAERHGGGERHGDCPGLASGSLQTRAYEQQAISIFLSIFKGEMQEGK